MQLGIYGKTYHSTPTFHCVMTMSRGAAGGTPDWGGSSAGASQHLAQEGRHGRAECFRLLLHGHMAARRELLVAGAAMRPCAQQLGHLHATRAASDRLHLSVFHAQQPFLSGHLGAGGEHIEQQLH